MIFFGKLVFATVYAQKGNYRKLVADSNYTRSRQVGPRRGAGKRLLHYSGRRLPSTFCCNLQEVVVLVCLYLVERAARSRVCAVLGTCVYAYVMAFDSQSLPKPENF